MEGGALKCKIFGEAVAATTKCMPTFTMFGDILIVIQGWSSKGLRDVIFLTFS